MTTNDVMRAISAFKKEQEEMRDDMERIEQKLDRLLSILEGKDVSKAAVATTSVKDTVISSETSQSIATKEEVEEAISEYLHRLGMPAHLFGYKCISRSIELILDDPSLIKNVTKRLYVIIAKELKFSPKKPEKAPDNVERSIRTAIEITWQRGDIQFIQKIFGHSINPKSGRPTNTEFLAMLTERVRMELKWKWN